MVIIDAIITNKSGLHARPASDFVKLASKFKSNITIISGNREVNAKSIISVLSAGLICGSKISIKADGEDESEAIESLIKLLQLGFGE